MQIEFIVCKDGISDAITSFFLIIDAISFLSEWAYNNYPDLASEAWKEISDVLYTQYTYIFTHKYVISL